MIKHEESYRVVCNRCKREEVSQADKAAATYVAVMRGWAIRGMENSSVLIA